LKENRPTPEGARYTNPGGAFKGRQNLQDVAYPVKVIKNTTHNKISKSNGTRSFPISYVMLLINFYVKSKEIRTTRRYDGFQGQIAEELRGSVVVIPH
jgi:hypothetical protein